MDKILIDRELLERICAKPYDSDECLTLDRGSAIADLAEMLARPAEAEGVEALTTWRADMEWPDDEMVVRQSDHLAALSAVTAERDRLAAENEQLESQGRYREQERLAAVEEADQLRAEVEALREDAERISFIEREWLYSPSGDSWSFGYREDWEKSGATLRDAIDADMAAKEA